MPFMNSWPVMVGNWARSRLCVKSSRMSFVRHCCSCPPVKWIGQVRWYSLSVVDIFGVTRSLRVFIERWGIALFITGHISRRLMSPDRGSACLSRPLGYRHSRKAAVKAPSCFYDIKIKEKRRCQFFKNNICSYCRSSPSSGQDSN